MHVPGVLHPAQLPQNGHDAHDVYVGVPLHVGPRWNTCGGTGGDARTVPQQMRVLPEQSLSDLHCLGQLVEQIPSQQSSPLDVQSLDCVHGLGHASKAGLRQSPEALKFGSTLFTDVQQTSPLAVWQSELDEHAFGHSFGGRQIDWL